MFFLYWEVKTWPGDLAYRFKKPGETIRLEVIAVPEENFYHFAGAPVATGYREKLSAYDRETPKAAGVAPPVEYERLGPFQLVLAEQSDQDTDKGRLIT